MFQSCSRWERVDETPYLIEVDPAERGTSPLEDDSLNSDEDEADDLADDPITLNLTADSWNSVDDELAEFMQGDDDEDSEHPSESDGERSDGERSEGGRSDDSTASTSSKTQNKRKRSSNGNTTDGSEADESDTSVTSTSRLQRRKKRTMERVTPLTTVLTAEKSSGLPTPEATGPEATGPEALPAEKAKAGPEDNGVAPDLAEDNDAALEAELIAGFESSDEE
jgi:RNA polymerase II subunit A-like phosphatase